MTESQEIETKILQQNCLKRYMWELKLLRLILVNSRSSFVCKLYQNGLRNRKDKKNEQ